MPAPSLLPLAGLVSLVAIALGGAACLDEELPLKCPTLRSAGGNPVGRWELIDVCLDAPRFMEMNCPELREEIQGIAGMGFIEYTATGQTTSDLKLTLMRQIVLPRRCATAVTRCEQIGDAYRLRKDLSVTGAVCRGTEECTCGIRQEFVSKGADSYEIRGGNKIYETSSMVTFDFAATSNELRLQTPGILIRLTRL